MHSNTLRRGAERAHSTTNGTGALRASTLRALQAQSAAGKGSHNDTLCYVLARNTKVTVRKWRHYEAAAWRREYLLPEPAAAEPGLET